jgi:LPXTG-motif cell wall-anchored protein
MNLSHTCLYVVPDPPDGPTQPPTPTPTPTPTTDVNGEVIATDIAAEELAATGADDWWIPLTAGLLLLLTGAGAILYGNKG